MEGDGLMRHHRRLVAAVVGAGGLLLSLLVTGQPAAAAATSGGGAVHVCTGTATAPGTLAGTYSNVVIKGVCFVNGGVATIRHDLLVSSNSALGAVFALNDVTKHGFSRLSVGGNLLVARGGTLFMGCERKIISVFGKPSAVFPCVDDPDQAKPTLSSHDLVGGSLIENHPLGVVVHNSTIGGSVIETGGGGGVTCTPAGIFKALKSPVYSDYEDNLVFGSVLVTGLRSCWYGTFRNRVGGSLTVIGNRMADPDAMEVTTNTVLGSLTCLSNKPAIQFGDSDGRPNRVGHGAFGECGFGVILPNPAPEAHLKVPVKHMHISVHLFSHRK
jgi:hypothetical protein